jgi:hypothetical protein
VTSTKAKKPDIDHATSRQSTKEATGPEKAVKPVENRE